MDSTGLQCYKQYNFFPGDNMVIDASSIISKHQASELGNN